MKNKTISGLEELFIKQEPIMVSGFKLRPSGSYSFMIFMIESFYEGVKGEKILIPLENHNETNKPLILVRVKYSKKSFVEISFKNRVGYPSKIKLNYFELKEHPNLREKLLSSAKKVLKKTKY